MTKSTSVLIYLFRVSSVLLLCSVKIKYVNLCDICHVGVIKGGKQEKTKERTILGRKSTAATDDNDVDEDD